MKQRLKKILPFIGYPAFYFLCFLVFVSLTFPYESLKDRIVLQFNAQQKATGAPQELHIDELTSSFITGVKATGVRLVSPPPKGKTEPSELRFDVVKARISLLPLLIGNKKVTFHIDAFDGEIDGSFAEHGKDREVEVEPSGVDLGKVGPLVDLVGGLPIQGKITGKVVITMPEGRASKGSGSVELEANDVALGDNKAKLLGLEFPRLNVGTFTFSAQASEGVLKVAKVGASGRDLELSGDGRVQMRELAMESLTDLNLKFKINDSFRGKNDTTKMLFGAPGSSRGGDIEFLDTTGKMRKAKTADGSYAFHMRGPLGKADLEPRGMAGGGGGGFGGMGPPGGGGFGSSGSGSSGSMGVP